VGEKGKGRLTHHVTFAPYEGREEEWERAGRE
jgi:hypothetical protein